MLAITNLPIEILSNIMSNVDSYDEIHALIKAHPIFGDAFNSSPVSIKNSLTVRKVEELVPGYGKQLFNLAWRIICLDRRILEDEYEEYQELKSLPIARSDLHSIFTNIKNAYDKVILKPNSYWIRFFNSHPGDIVAFTEEDVRGRLVYYSLRLTEYLMEAKYYEMAREINKDLIKGRAHPCRTYWEKFSYKELYCLWRTTARLVKIPVDAGMGLRDCLNRKRGEEGIEEVEGGVLYFPEWWQMPTSWDQSRAPEFLAELFGIITHADPFEDSDSDDL
ncbi:hypothetical protein RUND412_006198 [Rhizina undulata]